MTSQKNEGSLYTCSHSLSKGRLRGEPVDQSAVGGEGWVRLKGPPQYVIQRDYFVSCLHEPRHHPIYSQAVAGP
jgi:hypothetical protein